MRLALAQRNIKELTDKVAEIEAKQTATMQDAEGKIAQKVNVYLYAHDRELYGIKLYAFETTIKHSFFDFLHLVIFVFPTRMRLSFDWRPNLTSKAKRLP